MCDFCNGKKKKIENGYTYGNAYIKSTNYGYCYKIFYDNSGGEYGEGEFEINYCPICGRKLNNLEEKEQEKEILCTCINHENCPLDPASCGCSIETTTFEDACIGKRTFIPGIECDK